MCRIKPIPHLFFAGILLAGLWPMAGGSSWAAEKEVVNVHIPSYDTSIAPIFVAKERGYYEEEGMQARLLLSKAAIGIKALVAGSFDFSTAAGSASTAIVEGVPLRIVMITTFKPTFWIYTRQPMKSPLELKGKRIGVSSMGGLSDILARMALQQVGLDPLKDVITVVAGADAARVLALQGGSIDAAVLNAPSKFKAAELGFRELMFLGDKVEALSGGVAATVKYLQARPQTAQRFITATLKGQKAYTADREGSLPYMVKYMGVSEQVARNLYDATIAVFTPDGIRDEAFMRNEIQFKVSTLQPKKSPTPEQIFDLSLARAANAALRASNWSPTRGR